MTTTLDIPTQTGKREVREISLERAEEYLRNDTEGLIFSAYFRKKDGTMRTMSCRRYVRKGLRGGELPYDAKAKLLLPVFDMHLGDFRNVNMRTLVSFNIHGKTFIVTG